MAVRAAVANGNLTSSSTWATTDSTSYSNSESANTALTTSQVSSSTFTPGAITIDGIGVKIASRAASPTGTMTVQLTQAGTLVTGTNVTVNVSDLPTCTATSGSTTPVGTAEGGWFFFKFSSPVTLLAATAYAVSAATSSSSQVNLWSAATTNWSRYLRTTTTGSPVAADDLIITGEWTAAATVTARTVTMDSTSATAYGSNTTSQVTPSLSICNNGTLTFGTSASTNYILQQSGYIVVYNGGTLSVGIIGTPVPRGATATLQFNCTAAGDFGIVARNGAAVNMYGLSRTSGNNTVQTTLAANLAATGTAITTAVSTGWLNGDLICLAPTAQTSTQYESGTLNGNASGTSITLSAGATNAHLGTSPTIAEVGLLTQNVVMKAVTASSAQTFIYIGATATVNLSFTEFRYLSTNATGKRGIEIATTGNTFSMDSCSMHDIGSAAIYMTGASGSGFSITNTIFYNLCVTSNANGGFQTNGTSTGWTVNNCLFIGASSTSTTMIILNNIGGTFENTSVSGNTTGSNGTIQFAQNGAQLGTFSGVTVHSNGTKAVFFTSVAYGTLTSFNVWRNNGDGICVATPLGQVLSIVSSASWGNNGSGFNFGSSYDNIILDTCSTNSDTSFTQTNGVFIGGPYGGTVYGYNCSFSQSSGIKTACTNEFQWSSSPIVGPPVFLNSCLFGAATLFSNINAFAGGVLIAGITNFNQTANDNRSYYGSGTTTAGLIQTNTGTVYSGNPRSEQMTPATATFKLLSSPIFVGVPSGKAATPTVQVQKNSSYTGNAPRLVLKRNDALGITSDTVISTFSAAANTWQAQTGTTSAATQDGVFQFFVDCDGTAGSIFVGNATSTVA